MPPKSRFRQFIDSATQADITYVAKRADLSYEYLVYHVATGRKTVSERAAFEIEKATIALSKRKSYIKVVRCYHLIDTYKSCPHGIE